MCDAAHDKGGRWGSNSRVESRNHHHSHKTRVMTADPNHRDCTHVDGISLVKTLNQKHARPRADTGRDAPPAPPAWPHAHTTGGAGRRPRCAIRYRALS
eukprot:7375052-Prymnesium_polylepis.1